MLEINACVCICLVGYATMKQVTDIRLTTGEQICGLGVA